MLTWLRSRARDAVFLFPAGLARLGIVDREKADEAFDLAVPAMVTGGMRTLLRFADFFMVSVAVGEAGVAALEFGFQYFFVAFGLALALTSGTISVVSRFKGADDHGRADLAVKQSLWLSLAVSVPLTVGAWLFAEPLIGVLSGDPRTVELGATYLRILMLSAAFRFWSMTAARALAGAGDTHTPMYVRLLTLPTNVALNALLIFGLLGFPELGVAGAAWGTAVANTLAAVIFLGLFVSGRYPVRLRLGGRQFDLGIARELVRVAAPLAGTRLAQTFSRFPFLFVLGALGTPVVAAYAIGRRVILVAMMPAWGYSTASSTLVGQAIGAGDDREATEYGWQTLRLALATQLLLAAVLVVFAPGITAAFGADDAALTVSFIRMFGLSVAGFSVARTMKGGLRGAGDTRWPFYGTIAGSWVVRLPIAVTALPAGALSVTVAGTTLDPGLGLGVPAVFAAILADTYTRAGVNTLRFWSGKWQRVARESGVGADADGDGEGDADTAD
jgi:putative MATE family efflux protein